MQSMGKSRRTVLTGAQVRELAAYLEGRASEAAGRLAYEHAVVTRVAPLGMGDRRAQQCPSFPCHAVYLYSCTKEAPAPTGK